MISPIANGSCQSLEKDQIVVYNDYEQSLHNIAKEIESPLFMIFVNHLLRARPNAVRE